MQGVVGEQTWKTPMEYNIHHKEFEWDSPSLLLSPGEATSRVLSFVLGL